MDSQTAYKELNAAKASSQSAGDIYKAKSDTIKWLISDFDPPTHREVVYFMTFETMRVALAHGLSAMKEGGSWKPERYRESYPLLF